uniref:LSM14 domain-containing protein n=1 Tax=Syphacia muris TaxID=451379 RepID=A0A158R4G3_9BILA
MVWTGRAYKHVRRAVSLKLVMAQQTPYIGSKISLISKLDIRYEGILYTVDTNESTIALAKVRSFGTEDRPTPNPVAGRDDVYEYIIFKAKDIKDLIVCDTPKPVVELSSGLPYDPAIITVSQSHTAGMPSQAAVGSGLNAVSGGSSRSDSPNHVSPGVEGVSSGLSRAPGTGRSQRGAASAGQYPGDQSKNRGGFIQQIHLPYTANSNAMHMIGNNRPPPIQLPPNYNNVPPAGTQSYYPGFRSTGGQRDYYARGSGGQRGSRGGASGKPMQKEKQIKFESDYDFEKANEQFQETLSSITKEMSKTTLDEDGSDKSSGTAEKKSTTKEEAGVVDEQNSEETSFYDKSRSFFDRISCESLEKQEGKQAKLDWRKERETNQETFGHSAVRSLAFRRGRGMRGGRGMNYRRNDGFRFN